MQQFIIMEALNEYIWWAFHRIICVCDKQFRVSQLCNQNVCFSSVAVN